MARDPDLARDRATLGALLDRLGLPATLISPIQGHARAVGAAAGRLGLVSPEDAGNVVRRHSADSLLFAVVRKPGSGERWVDIGSGAGFPGVVLACCFPECKFTLLEPLKRRAGFLELVAVDLGLTNVEVLPRRLEELAAGPFDVAVARAFSDPTRVLQSMLTAVRPGGQAIVAMGKDARPEPAATVVVVDDLGDVDSPGLFSMMTRSV